ncbi:hypothetical protein ACFSO7_06900 [Bacillus sp. CGMCC 1.16607]|uniref:hypothetical protein n=1 Tax=Bacillus sp. CGMCC 1.16607 TaxID=3351842 RepID=UPI00363409AE
MRNNVVRYYKITHNGKPFYYFSKNEALITPNELITKIKREFNKDFDGSVEIITEEEYNNGANIIVNLEEIKK